MIKKISKALAASFCLSLALLSVAFAADTSFAFNTGAGGNGYVDGSRNGIYYTFSKGKSIKLDLTDSRNCDTGKYAVTVYINDAWFGQGTNCGTNVFSSKAGLTHSEVTYSAPKDSSKYYMFIAGQGTLKQYAASGTITQ